MRSSRPIILDDTPDQYRPTVQVIDSFVTNHKLGLIAETRVGEGRMLICAVDLLGHRDQPAARQLLQSLLRYVDSAAFTPEAELDRGLLARLLPQYLRASPRCRGRVVRGPRGRLLRPYGLEETEAARHREPDRSRSGSQA